MCCIFLLLSFVFLPVTKTSRHYLTIGLVTGCGLLSLGFMVPLWSKPNECFDRITANDMYSNLACAWSGAIVMVGGLAAVMWIFNRSLSLHLQICWQMTMGKKFLYCTHALAWGVTVLLAGVTLALSGVSYRFGNVCHVNHNNSVATFWGPILGFAALAAILQFITLGYCIKVYLRNLWDPNTASGASSSMPSALPSMTGGSSIKTRSARATYRRVRKVIALQWRGVVVVMILLISAIYFAIIFQLFDSLSQQAIENPQRTEKWVLCMAANKGKKEACLNFVNELSLSEPVVLAVLFLISLMGYWCLLFLGRLSMFSGWWEIIRRSFQKNSDFVSYDARRISDPRNYEMLTSPPQTYHLTKGPQGGLVATAKPPGFEEQDELEVNALQLKEFVDNYGSDESPVDDSTGGIQPSTRFNANARTQSFSQPRPPTRNSQQGRVTFSREGPTEIPLVSETPLDGWPSAISRPMPAYSPSREVASPQDEQRPPLHQSTFDDLQQRNASVQSYSSTTQLRSGSALSDHARSGSALGRAWPVPAPSSNTRTYGSPTPHLYRSNSRTGALTGSGGAR